MTATWHAGAVTDQRRRIRLLVPGDDGYLVATEHGRLPARDLTLEDGESTLTAMRRLLPAIGLPGHALDVVLDQRRDDDLDGATRQALIVLEPQPVDWSLPPGWSWGPSADLADLPEALAAVATGRLDELAGRRPVPAQRAAWLRPGWYDEVVAWIDDVLRSSGRPAADEVVPIRQWGISTVLRADTPAGRVWFKAAFPGFRQEAAITEWLHRVSPGSVPPVLAADRDRGWLLLDDLGDRTEAADEPATRAAIDELVTVQRLTVDRLDELRDLGAPDRRLGRLVGDLVEALDTTVAREILGDPHPPSMVEALTEAIAHVDGVLPDVLVHGDFHPGNIAPRVRGATVFDWSDAAISSPFVDIPTWTWWYPDDDDRVELVWSCFEAAWDREHDLRPGTIDRRAALTAAGAYHTVSYLRILERLEPLARHEHADGVTHFYELVRRGCRDGRDES